MGKDVNLRPKAGALGLRAEEDCTADHVEDISALYPGQTTCCDATPCGNPTARLNDARETDPAGALSCLPRLGDAHLNSPPHLDGHAL